MSRKRANGERTYARDKTTGRWEGRATLGGKRVKRRGATRAEVVAKLDEVERRYRMGAIVTGPGTRTTLAEWADTYLGIIRPPAVAPATWARYESNLRVNILPRLGRFPLHELERAPGLIQQALHDLADHGMAPISVNRVRIVIRAVLFEAIQHGLMVNNPAAITRPMKVQPFQAQALALDEATRLLQLYPMHRDGPLWAVALCTGLRQGELLGLRRGATVAALGLPAPTLTVDRKVVHVGALAVWGPPKTESGRRVVPLVAPAVRAIRLELAMQDADKRRHREWQDEGLLFPTDIGTVRHPSNVRRRWYEWCRQQGFPPIRFHDLRHSTGTLLHGLGVDSLTLVAIMGHSSVAQTKTYVHVSQDVMRRGLDKLADATDDGLDALSA